MKMYRILLCFGLILYCSAAPTSDDARARIISYESSNSGLGDYSFSYETSNGIIREETGRLVNVGLPDEHIEVEGFYTYFDTNGERVIIRYTAGSDGSKYYHGNKPQLQPTPFVEVSIPPRVLGSLLGG